MLNKLFYNMGFRTVLPNVQAPGHLFTETSPGQYDGPKGALVTQLSIQVSLRMRFMILLSGRVGFVNTIWVAEETKVLGDAPRMFVLPPFSKVAPLLPPQAVEETVQARSTPQLASGQAASANASPLDDELYNSSDLQGP